MNGKVRGRGTFIAGAIALLIMAGFHSLAVINTEFGEPLSEADAAWRQAARDVDLTVGPLEATAWGASQILSASYCVLLVQAAAISLLCLRPMIEQKRLRSLTLANLIFTALLLAIAIAYQFAPPIVFTAVAFLLFAASLYRQMAST